MNSNKKQQRRSAIIVGLVCLMLLMAAVGVSAAKAQAPAPDEAYLASVKIESQQAEMTYPDGSRRPVRIEGSFEGQPNDGTTVGTIQVDDSSRVVRYEAMGRSDLTLDENGRPTRVTLPVQRTTVESDGTEATDATTITLTLVESGIELELGDATAVVEGQTCWYVGDPHGAPTSLALVHWCCNKGGHCWYA